MDPVTGPFTTSIEIKGGALPWGFRPIAVSIVRVSFKQKPPYNQSLPYQLDKMVYDLRYSFTGNGYAGWNPPGRHTQSRVMAQAKAYEAFKSRTGDYSQWANNLLEAGKSLDSATSAAVQLYRAAVRVKKFDFSGAARILNILKPSGASRKKQFAHNWLEYHFGWEPLLADIHSGMKSLSRDFSPKAISGRGSVDLSNPYSHTDSGQGFGGSYISRVVTEETVKTSVKIGANIRVVNPNANLVREVGLINPLSVAWEAVPFSFVVDWFSNVGQVLDSATEFVGLEITQAYTTVFTRTRRTETSLSSYSAHPEWFSSESHSKAGIFVDRSLGISSPSFYIKPFKGFSVIRGATAVALLTTFLKGNAPSRHITDPIKWVK